MSSNSDDAISGGASSNTITIQQQQTLTDSEELIEEEVNWIPHCFVKTTRSKEVTNFKFFCYKDFAEKHISQLTKYLFLLKIFIFN